MPWLKEILKAKLPTGDLQAVDLAGHGLYRAPHDGRLFLFDPRSQQVTYWMRADHSGPR
jgi:hypothetical protein